MVHREICTFEFIYFVLTYVLYIYIYACFQLVAFVRTCGTRTFKWGIQ